MSGAIAHSRRRASLLMQVHAPRPNLGDIRANLHAADVLQRYGIEVKEPPRGDWYSHVCPRTYHRKSARAFVINPESGLWQCFAGCVGPDDRALGGDLFTFIGECERLSLTGEDFAKVAAIAADIAGVEVGVEMSTEERTRRRQRHREDMERRRREQAEQKRWHRTDSIVKATAYWDALVTRSAPGEVYLAARGIGDAVARGIVRFDRSDRDSIALALRTSDGQIGNVIRRRLPAYASTPDGRFRPLAGLWAEGTYLGALDEIGPGRDVVLCEGFADSITAALAWPTAIVLGARSASNLPTIARYAAPLVERHGVRLLVVAHRDNAGFNAARAAIHQAHAAGLRLRNDTLHIVKHGADDLNAAWCRGWRPSTWSMTS